MPKTYVTFGQDHAHVTQGGPVDKDTVAVIECASATEGRNLAFELFDSKFCFEYHEAEFDHDSMRHYSKGFVEVN